MKEGVCVYCIVVKVVVNLFMNREEFCFHFNQMKTGRAFHNLFCCVSLSVEH